MPGQVLELAMADMESCKSAMLTAQHVLVLLWCSTHRESMADWNKRTQALSAQPYGSSTVPLTFYAKKIMYNRGKQQQKQNKKYRATLLKELQSLGAPGN